jgi:4-hydroxy-tetrahydrodipicolinate synthase
VCPLVNHHSLSETIDLARHAAQAGCDFVALLNPPLGARAEEAVYRFFRQVCDAARTPVVIFNTPSSGYSMTPALIARIVKGGNVAGLKTTASESANSAIRAHCSQLIVSDPHEAHWLRNMRKHRQPVLFADPEPYLFQTPSHKPIASYTAAHLAGDDRSANRLSRSLSPIRAVYAEWIKRPLLDGRMPNAALKTWSSLIGLAGGAVRPPLVDLAPKERLLLEEALLTHLSKRVMDNHAQRRPPLRIA